MTIFNSLIPAKARPSIDSVAGLSDALSSLTTDRYSKPEVSKNMIANESYSESHERDATTAFSDIVSEIKAATQTETSQPAFEAYQENAAAVAGLYASAPSQFYSKALRGLAQSDLVVGGGGSNFERGSVATESYSDEEIRNNRKFTVIYNLLATRTDELTQAWFPTILLDPMESGIEMNVTVSVVFRDLIRNVTGAVAAFNRQNTIRAYRDAKILEQTHTTLYPVYRAEGGSKNIDKFADAALIEPRVQPIGSGVEVLTSPLLCGQSQLDMIGISQRNELLANGKADHTDQMGRVVRLKKIYIKLGDVVVPVDVYNTTGSIFVPTQIGNKSKLNLAFDTSSIVIRAGAKDANGEDVANKVISENNIRLQVNITGTAITDEGKVQVSATQLSVVAVTDAKGQLVTKAVLDDIKALVDDATVYAFDLEAFFANENLRVTGQLVETKEYLLSVPVGFQSPFSIYKSSFTNDDQESQLAELIALTSVRISNQSVAKIIETSQALANYVNIPDAEGTSVEFDSVGSYYMLPYHSAFDISINQILQGTASANRKEDIEGALTQVVLRAALDLNEGSEYTQAGIKLTGNPAFKPKVIIATSVKIAAYLPAKFSYGVFDFEVQTSLNEELDNKIFISFQNTASTDGGRKLDPLNFGNLVWAPELVSNMNREVRGATSRMLTVMGRWAHIVNAPALIDITVTDLEAIADKVVYFTKQQ